MNKKIKAVQLVEDFGLYPRSIVDSTHVTALVAALEAGETLPPIIVDQKNRVIDGFHRRRAALRFHGDKAVMDCEVRTYKTEAAAFLDALRLNSRHGKGIVGSEQTGAVIKARILKIEPELIASAMAITVERVEKITTKKITYITPARKLGVADEIPLKGSVRHLSGNERGVNKKQAEAIKHAPGQPQSLLIRQLNELLEAALIDWENSRVVAGMKRLSENLTKFAGKII